MLENKPYTKPYDVLTNCCRPIGLIFARLLYRRKVKKVYTYISLWKAVSNGRWNRGSRGSSCCPNFWHGRAGHSSCSPKSLRLLHCDVRLSPIDFDIFEFCHSVGRSRTKKLSASGRLRPPDPPPGALPLDPAGGSAPRPPLYARPLRAHRAPPLPNPKYATVCAQSTSTSVASVTLWGHRPIPQM